MAKYTENFTSKVDWAMPFQRTGAFPLDRSTMFDSYTDAVKYAAGNLADPDSRNLCGSSYIGQTISVFEADKVTLYKIVADRTLSEIGAATQGDNKSIVLDGLILKIKGFDTATVGQSIHVVNKGTDENPDLELEFYTPDTSVVDQLYGDVKKLNSDETIEGSVAHSIKKFQTDVLEANYYNKTTIDGKLTSALHYMGSVNSLADLEATVTDGSYTPAAGDTWNIATAGGTDVNGNAIKAGDNVIWNATAGGWDDSAGVVDLSNYYNKTEIAAELAKKADASALEAVDDRVTDLETVVGDATTGMVKDVTDLKTAKTDHETRITGLETKVGTPAVPGDAENPNGTPATGLLKDVEDLQDAVDTLNGDESTPGSVKNLVAATTGDIQTAITNITKEGGTIDTKIGAHETGTDAHAALFAKKQNRVFQVPVKIKPSGFTANTDSTKPGNYVGSFGLNGDGGIDASKKYDMRVVPVGDQAALNIVMAAGFAPYVAWNNGTLELYCENVPTGEFNVTITCTELTTEDATPSVLDTPQE